MLEIGRLCIKTAGRDATMYCVVIENIDKNYVLVDGNVRRKKVNKLHLEPLNKVLKIEKGAETKEVLELLGKEGFKITKNIDKKPKKEKTEQIKKSRQGTLKSEKKKVKENSKK